MIQSFSPLTRRILAVGLLVLLVLLGLRLAAGLGGAISSSLEELEDSRFRLARMEALRTRAAPPAADPLPAGLTLAAASHEDAAAQALAAVNGAAGAAQLTLARAAPLPQEPGNPNLVQVTLSAAGPEAAVLAFVSELEKSTPPVRLASWRIAAAPGGGLAVEGVAAAAWGGAR